MQLVDIAEPEVARRTTAFGIDLGTTRSLVARVEAGREVSIFCDAHGRSLVPSVVEYDERGDVRVGNDIGTSNAVRSIKRLMGRNISEVADKFCGFRVLDQRGGIALDVGNGRCVTPVEISSEILKHLSALVKTRTGEEINRAVITVPAYFDEVARKATRDAASAANIEVLRLLSEPTAAALVYEQIQDGETFIVYDLGGGTFDISIVKMHGGVLQIIATGGDTNLGGDDIDQMLSQWVLEKYVREGGISAGDVSCSLLLDARQAKEKICSGYEGSHKFRVCGESDFFCTVSRGEFSDIANVIVSKTISITHDTMQQASIEPSDISRVILVGGSSKMPQVKEALRGVFSCEICDDVDPERAVVTGAALQAYYLSDPRAVSEGKVLIDVVPLSLSLETVGGIAEVIIPRNTPVPAVVSQEFTTYMDGQTLISIHVCQGEREIVSENRTLAKFDFRVPPMPAGEARVKVEFRVDMDGLLTVCALDTDAGTEKIVEINAFDGITQSDIEKCVMDSVKNFDSDIATREWNIVKTECERVVEVMREQLDGVATQGLDIRSAQELLSNVDNVLLERDVVKARDFIQKVGAAVADLRKKRSGVLCEKEQ
ncbi:Hsp70 family protein [Anaplasma bovis]|uniref:Hsp70 family protein n=1 Tax=Anaplasma bovis TaxID=186733 RepID=UPI002FEF829C